MGHHGWLMWAALSGAGVLAAEAPDYGAVGRALRVREGHPILFLNAAHTAAVRARPENLKALANTVGKYRLTGTRDPADRATIRREVARWNDRTHPGEYLQTSMWFALEAYLNRNPLATAFGREYLRAIVELAPSRAQNAEAQALGTAFAGGVLYDYLYPDLDAELRHLTREAVVAAGETLRQLNYLQPEWVIGGHGCCWAQPYLLVGLLGIHQEMASEPAELRARYDQLLGLVVTCTRASTAAREWICRDGGYQMGWDYGSCYTTMIPYLAWEFATAEPSLFGPWQEQMTWWYLYGLRHQAQVTYATQPTALQRVHPVFPASGDIYGGARVGADPMEAWLIGGWKYQNPVSQWTVNHFVPQFPDVTAWQMVLYRLFDATAGSPPTALPLSRCFRHAGSVVLRDSWDFDRATQVVFKSSPFFSNNHHHRDQNSFVIHYQAPLAIDSGGYGRCGEYGSRHWYNYYIRSVAHNTVLVYDPQENFGESRHGRNSNDGGQAMWPFGSEAGQLADIVAGGKQALDGILRYEDQPAYSYVLGDATKAYAPAKLQRFQRQMVFLRGHSAGHPVIVVHDRVITTNPAFRKTWLLHSIDRPATDGCLSWFDAAEGGDPARRGRLYHEVLLPADATIQAVGGVAAQQEFWVADDGHGQPHNYREEFLAKFPTEALQEPAQRERGDLRELGGWRLEVSPGAARADDTFLNVLSVTDAGPAARAVQARLVPTPVGEAVALRDLAGPAATLLLFWRAEEPLRDVDLDLAGCRRALLVGLPPGVKVGCGIVGDRLQLRTGPRPPAARLTSDQGTIWIGDR
ncbi:MAG: heparinase II/III family protein [Fimbriimonadaceae bacterium]|nr:heparinase II/III family protein [Fimbriimonadaceae bacterium]